MKFLGITITTKKELKREIAQLQVKLTCANEINTEIVKTNEALGMQLAKYTEKYPFEIGQVVYDIQFRSSKGRFTKTKASREHSIINEVVVDKKNYFNLVDRFIAKDVFTELKAAEAYLDEVCVE